MGLFTEHSFSRYFGKLLVIYPYRADSFTGVGYDLTVGLLAHVDPTRRKILKVVRVNEQDAEASITLKPNTYGIVISNEHIFLSRRLAGTFHSKSSLAAQAVYLNSTSCDPNWKGRLIFSLYNASGISVSLDLDRTFATLCVHEVERPSSLRPKDSKAVIEKYLEGLEGDSKSIVGYVLRDDRIKQEFEKQVDRAIWWARVPYPVLRLCLNISSIASIIARYWLATLGMATIVIVIVVLQIPGVVVGQVIKWSLTGIATLAACVTIWDFYRRNKKA